MIEQILNSRYLITARLGKGAMGTVYRATDTSNGHDVALKIISSELVVDPAMLERFKREGEALSKLKHPNIVGFVEAFQHDEYYVIIMEYVSGGSLYDLIKKGPLPIGHTIQIAIDLCDALIRAHRLNIIHRDLKPENILIDEDGTPKLADFGVARLSEVTRMTRSGVQVGTPYYMSPEAWEGKTLDAQADIWSLGIVLFEMLTGQVPFSGDTPLAVMTKINTTPPPDLKKLRSDVPSSLVKIISRMLTRNKKRRYQTMREVAADLEHIQQAAILVPAKDGPKDAVNIEREKKRQTAQIAVLKVTLLNLALPRTMYFLKIAAIAGVIVLLFWIVIQIVSKLYVPVPTATSTLTLSLMPTSTTTHTVSSASATPKPSLTPVITLTPVHVVFDPHPDSLDHIDDKGVPMRLVTAGEFTMGSNEIFNEQPIHQVSLDAYYMDKYEVTNALYKVCVNAKVCDEPSNKSKYNNPKYKQHPVVYINWDQAKVYCEWRGARLPTEAEWEKAARGTDERTYPWGERIDCDMANYDGCVDDTTEIGNYLKGESPYGLYDMAGNVWERVADWYLDTYYTTYSNDQWPSNPSGPESGDHRILRGGSWRVPDVVLRSAERGEGDPTGISLDVGFRCARSTSP